MIQQGDIVFYLTPENETFPAMIVKVWGKDSWCCNLLVFRDGTNEMDAKVYLVTSALRGNQIGQWHTRESECMLVREREKELKQC